MTAITLTQALAVLQGRLTRVERLLAKAEATRARGRSFRNMQSKVARWEREAMALTCVLSWARAPAPVDLRLVRPDACEALLSRTATSATPASAARHGAGRISQG